MASPACWGSTGWKRAATSLWAIVAGWRCDSFRHFWTTAARPLRQSTEYLWPIVAANFHKSSRYLCATAATGWRQSTEYLLPIAAFHLRKWFRFLCATAAGGLRQSAEYVGTTVAGHLGKSSKIRTALVAALAIASSLVGFVTTSALLRPPAPPPVRHEARLQPKLSWVTDYEIERAQNWAGTWSTSVPLSF